MENKKGTGLMEDELGAKVMEQFPGLRAKICSYLTENSNEDKKAKSTTNSIVKRKIKFED